MRKKIPRGSVIKILNTPLNELGLSVALTGSLKALELTSLSEAKILIEENPKKIKDKLGLNSLVEIKRIFNKNGIKLPQNF